VSSLIVTGRNDLHDSRRGVYGATPSLKQRRARRRVAKREKELILILGNSADLSA